MTAIKEKVDVKELIARADELIKEGIDFLVKEGKIINFDGWLSISEYSQKYRIPTQNISQWILRGVIPEKDWIEIDKFGKKLVRDKMYKN